MFHTIRKTLPYFTVLGFLLLQVSAQAQCLTGDCENGTGSFKLTEGIYEGSFKNGLPNGRGSYRGLLQTGNGYVDSVFQTGVFIDGIIVEGKRKLLGRWSIEHDWAGSTRYALGGYRAWGGSWLVPKEFKPEEENIPLKGEYVENISTYNKMITTKYTSWAFLGAHVNFTWVGKLKNGRMDGPGDIRIYDRVIAVNFKDGVPYGQTDVKRWPDMYNRARLDTFIIKDGLVVEQRVIVKDGILIQNPNVSIYEMLYYNNFGSSYGIFTKHTKDSSIYFGEIKDGLPNGFGKTTYTNGNFYEGFNFQGFRHGPGKLVSAGNGMDTGFYFLGKFLKGTKVRSGKPDNSHPFCASGNCENGTGIARYVANNSDSLDDVYEGNFVNGMPSGYGEWNYKSGKYQFTKKGDFIAGTLNGYAEIETNIGIIRKLKGKFLNDTLKSGTIFYNDGSSFESGSIESETIFGITNKKTFGGRGIYRSAQGTELTGEFNFFMQFMNGRYENAAGIVLPQFGSFNDPYLYLRLANWYDLDKIDGYVNSIVAKLKINAAQQEKDAIAFKLKQERDRKYAENYRNPANFSNTSGYQSCSACFGRGHFDESHTIDGNYIKKYYDSKGNPKEVEIVRTGRTYNFKVRCNACNGAGKIYVNSKKYIGPEY